MRVDKDGNSLVRHIDLKIITPEGHNPIHQILRAGPRQGFREEDIDTTLDNATEHVEKRFPFWEFRVVERGRNAFTFVYAGLKPQGIVQAALEQFGHDSGTQNP
jgi:hypothetical protein